MHRSNTIQKKLALLLLMVFAISITPKILFHEALANHKDGLVCQDTDKSAPHFHQPSFHCSFDDLVVSSPFLPIELKEIATLPVVYLNFSPQLSSFFVSFPSLHKEGRGPPLM